MDLIVFKMPKTLGSQLARSATARPTSTTSVSRTSTSTTSICSRTRQRCCSRPRVLRRIHALVRAERAPPAEQSRSRHGDLRVDREHPVLAVHVDHPRPVLVELGGLVVCIGDDDHRVAALHQARRGTVDVDVS
jgi:hypothetical protein